MIRTWLSLLLCLCVALTGTSCQQQPSGGRTDAPQGAATPEQAAPTWKQHTDPVTLTFSGSDTSTSGNYLPKWAEDPISRMVSDLTGVTLVLEKGLEHLSASPNGSLFSLMAASNDFSDLVFFSDEFSLVSMSDASYACALDELAAAHCPDFWDGIDPLEKLNNESSDGHVYTLRVGYYDEAVYADPRIPIDVPRLMILRQDLLEQLGRPVPTSVEELESLLYLIKQRGQELDVTYPLRQINAVASPIADWMGVRQFLHWDQQTRSVRTPLRDPQWLPYLQLMNKWYRDGVLALPEEEIMRRPDNHDPYDTGDYLVDTQPLSFATASTSMSVNIAWYALRENANDQSEPFPYLILEEPLTYEGEIQFQAADHAINPKMQSNQARGGLFIAKSCLHQDRAIHFMQFLRSDEGAKLTHWGIEGVHYDYDEETGLSVRPEYRYPQETCSMNDLSKVWDSWRQDGLQYWTFMDQPWVNGMLAASLEGCYTNQDTLAARQMLIRAGVNYKAYAAKNKVPVFSFAEPEVGSADYEAYTALQDYWYQAMWEIVRSPSSQEVSSRWEAMLEQLSSMGIDAIEQGMTVRFTEALARYHEAGYFTEIQP